MRSTDALDKGLPAAIDAEKTILGAILLDNASFDQAIGLKPEHFFLDGHRRTFAAMLKLQERNHPIDMVTLTDLLISENDLQATGGIAYIATFTDGVPRRPSIAQYVRIVKDKALSRILIHSCHNAISQAIEQAEPIREVMGRVETELFEATAENQTREFANTKAIVEEEHGSLESFLNRKAGGRGLMTHYSLLDSMTGGLQPSDLILLAARPSMGKTALAMNIAEHAAVLDNKAVGIFSLEMDRAMLLDRAACSMAKVNLLDFRSGYCDQHAKHRVQAALDKLLNAPIYIDDTPGLTIVEMRSKARRLARALGRLDLLIVDYIQLMLSKGRAENRNQEISAISRGLKLLARELGCPLVALSQLNRKAENRDGNEPQLSDLRDSGSLEQDADLVMLLFRPEYYDRESDALRGIAKLNVAKQRNGPTDTVDLHFQRQWARFENLEVNHATR